MNGPLPVFIAFLLTLLVIGWRKPKYLFLIWPIILLVFPTTRSKLGPIPIYWFDAVTVILLAKLYASHTLRRWPGRIPKWHWWFIAVAFVFGTIFPIIRYGVSREMFWIFGHAALAWMAFSIGVSLYISQKGEEYRSYLAAGLLIAIALSAVAAMYQFGSPARASAVNAFYFGDIEDSIKLAEFSAEYNAQRVNGPHGGPNGFGGTTAIAVAVFLLVSAMKSKRWAYLAIFLATVVVAATVSRQVLVAVAAGAMIAFFFTRSKGRVRIISITAIAVLAALGTGISENWGSRLSKWEGGVDEDKNVMGRLVIGPQRMFNVISQDVTVLIGGVGLDVQKLVKKAEGKSQDVGFYNAGFVSNSFLLPLYYLGIFGFLLTLIFWFWIIGKTLKLPVESRALGIGCVGMTMLLVAADNYAFLKEPAVAMIFLLAASIAGKWYASQNIHKNIHNETQSKIQDKIRST